MLTPVKRPPSLLSFSPQLKQSFQLSPYQSPTSSRDKGKGVRNSGLHYSYWKSRDQRKQKPLL